MAAVNNGDASREGVISAEEQALVYIYKEKADASLVALG